MKGYTVVLDASRGGRKRRHYILECRAKDGWWARDAVEARSLAEALLAFAQFRDQAWFRRHAWRVQAGNKPC
ncbi:MAG TPA: hypothetical protein PKY77_22080 [Phycisphaerae bacterium]|nr:hypothetical protein [Phycisphaerae bacterium]